MALNGQQKTKSEVELDKTQPSQVTRRIFLKAAILTGAGVVLAACGTDGQSGFGPENYATNTPAAVLASPRPPQGTEQMVELSPELTTFLALSTALTGVEHLNPELGRAYLEHLPGGDLAALYDALGVGTGETAIRMDDLQAAGIFDQKSSQELADQIIHMWYSGTVQEGEQTVVVTYVDALAWKVLTFTKPRTICGNYGFWAERPDADVSY